jgi:hypothetical protein
VQGRESNGTQYFASFSDFPANGDNTTWLSPDGAFGVQIFGLTYGLSLGALVRA